MELKLITDEKDQNKILKDLSKNPWIITYDKSKYPGRCSVSNTDIPIPPRFEQQEDKPVDLKLYKTLLVSLMAKIQGLEETLLLKEIAISSLRKDLAKKSIFSDDIKRYETEIEDWRSKCNNAQIQLEVYQNLLKDKGPKSEFTVREIAIIALALFRKGGVVPKNKKNIAKLFSKMLGVSANTLSVNLCSTYTNEEILSITNRIKDYLPEFADYLSENKIETEIKK